MKEIRWREAFSVGVRELDDQHRELIELLAELARLQREGEGQAHISAALTRLVDYIAEHFAAEESYMVRFSCADLRAHREEHRAFIRKILDFRKDYLEGRETLGEELIAFLMQWLEGHILGTDQGYRECFRENGLG